MSCKFAVLFGLKIFLSGAQVFFIESFLLLLYALLAVVVGACAQEVLLHLQAVFLHSYFGVAQHVLFFSQLRFRVENLLAQVRIVQSQNYVAFLYHSSFFHPFAFHDTGLEGRYLHDHTGLHATVKTDEVVEHSGGYNGGADGIGISFIG